MASDLRTGPKPRPKTNNQLAFASVPENKSLGRLSNPSWLIPILLSAAGAPRRLASPDVPPSIEEWPPWWLRQASADGRAHPPWLNLCGLSDVAAAMTVSSWLSVRASGCIDSPAAYGSCLGNVKADLGCLACVASSSLSSPQSQ